MKDYTIIKQIRAAETDPQISRILERLYTRLESHQSYAAALSSSVELFLALKHVKKNPQLILGSVGVDTFLFPHAWVEMDKKIYDISIYFDTKYHPVLNQKMDVISPQIAQTYQAADIDYFAFQFSDTWELSDMKRVVGSNMKGYCDNNPTDNMWNDICYILDLSPVPDQINPIKELAEKEIIKDVDETVDRT